MNGDDYTRSLERLRVDRAELVRVIDEWHRSLAMCIVATVDLFVDLGLTRSEIIETLDLPSEARAEIEDVLFAMVGRGYLVRSHEVRLDRAGRDQRQMVFRVSENGRRWASTVRERVE